MVEFQALRVDFVDEVTSASNTSATKAGVSRLFCWGFRFFSWVSGVLIYGKYTCTQGCFVSWEKCNGAAEQRQMKLSTPLSTSVAKKSVKRRCSAFVGAVGTSKTLR